MFVSKVNIHPFLVNLAQITVVFADISAATSMTLEDICATLNQQSMISAREVTPPIPKPSPGQSIKFPKGRKNGFARKHLQRTQTSSTVDDKSMRNKGPFVPPTQYEIRWDPEKVAAYLKSWESKNYLKLKPEKLKWSPFLLARMKANENTEPPDVPQVAVQEADSQPVLQNDEAASAVDTIQLAKSIFDNADTPVELIDPPDTEMVQDADVLPVFTSALSRRRVRNSSVLSSSTPRSTDQTRSIGSSASQTIHDDEALAAKLDLEERLGRRQLRPRSRMAKTPLIGQWCESNGPRSSASRSSSPKKRRRLIESTSEGGDEEYIHVQVDELSNPVSVDGLSDRDTAPPRHCHTTSSLMPNGRGNGNHMQNHALFGKDSTNSPSPSNPHLTVAT